MPRTCDFHIDLPWQITKQDLTDITPASQDHVSLEGMDKGGLDIAFMPLYLAPSRWQHAGEHEIWDNYFYKQVEVLKASGQFRKRLIPSIENMAPWAKVGLAQSLAYFKNHLKPRVVGLVHNQTNEFADSATDDPQHAGLSAAGVKLVKDLDAMGILIDVSHASDQVVWHVDELITNPMVATHSASDTIHPHRRNISNGAAMAVAKSGGVIGVPFVDKFIGKGNLLGDHILSLVNLVGIKHVGIGSDLDGATLAPGLDKVESWKAGVLAHLSHADLTPIEMDHVMGENILRLFPDI